MPTVNDVVDLALEWIHGSDEHASVLIMDLVRRLATLTDLPVQHPQPEHHHRAWRLLEAIRPFHDLAELDRAHLESLRHGGPSVYDQQPDPPPPPPPAPASGGVEASPPAEAKPGTAVGQAGTPDPLPSA